MTLDTIGAMNEATFAEASNNFVNSRQGHETCTACGVVPATEVTSHVANLAQQKPSTRSI